MYFHDVARTASRGATALSGDVAWKDKPTPSAAINFRHSLKTSVSRCSLLPASGHALHRRGLYFHDVARTASRGAASPSGGVAWKDKPTPSAAINFRHFLKTSVSRHHPSTGGDYTFMMSQGRHLGAQRPFQQAFLGKIGLRFPGTQSPVGAIHYSEGYIPSNRIHIWFGISGRNVPFGRRCLERQTHPVGSNKFSSFPKNIS